MSHTRQVLVDADACPRGALNILKQIEQTGNYRLVTVASFNHVLDSPHHVTVGNGPDEADLAVANRVVRGDIVVTQDWGLAALCLARGAKVISPRGLVYTAANIDFLLDERYAKAKLRRQGGRTHGPSARTAADDAAFASALRQLLAEP